MSHLDLLRRAPSAERATAAGNESEGSAGFVVGGAHALASIAGVLLVGTTVALYACRNRMDNVENLPLRECPHISCMLKQGTLQYRFAMIAVLLVSVLLFSLEIFYPFRQVPPATPPWTWKVLLIACVALLTLCMVLTLVYKLGQGQDTPHHVLASLVFVFFIVLSGIWIRMLWPSPLRTVALIFGIILVLLVSMGGLCMLLPSRVHGIAPLWPLAASQWGGILCFVVLLQLSCTRRKPYVFKSGI